MPINSFRHGYATEKAPSPKVILKYVSLSQLREPSRRQERLLHGELVYQPGPAPRGHWQVGDTYLQ